VTVIRKTLDHFEIFVRAPLFGTNTLLGKSAAFGIVEPKNKTALFHSWNFANGSTKRHS
jgi:hypothetical protein